MNIWTGMGSTGHGMTIAESMVPVPVPVYAYRY
jgi:hypothetical protein